MKLELDGEEVKAILLEYAQQKFPGQFDEVTFDAGYHRLDSAILSKADPVPEKPPGA